MHATIVYATMLSRFAVGPGLKNHLHAQAAQEPNIKGKSMKGHDLWDTCQCLQPYGTWPRTPNETILLSQCGLNNLVEVSLCL